MLNVERRVDAYGEVGPPKSDAGVREVPLSSMLLRLLKEWRLQSKYSNADDLIFPNKKGRFMCHDNFIKRRYKTALAVAEVFDINWHSLRHYAVSTWIKAGLAPKTVQAFAGHSSLQVTMDRYGHLFPSDDHKAAMGRESKGVDGMKKTLLAVGWLAATMFAPSDAASQSPSGWDGNFWFTVCGSKGQLESSICTAHISGLRGAFEMSVDYYKVEKKRRLYCATDDVTLQQSIDVFVKFLRDNPKHRNNTSRVLFSIAMGKAFPCQ